MPTDQLRPVDHTGLYVPPPVLAQTMRRLAVVARAGLHLAQEADRLLLAGAPVDEHTLARLSGLLAELRVAVVVRGELAGTDREVLLAAAALLGQADPGAPGATGVDGEPAPWWPGARR